MKKIPRRFSIRHLMIGIAVCALAIAYLESSGNRLFRQVYYEERAAGRLYELGADYVKVSDHRIVQIDFYHQPATDEALSLIGDLRYLESLNLNGVYVDTVGHKHQGPVRTSPHPCQVSDAGLAHLGGLTQLKALQINLEGTSVTKAGLDAFRQMRALRHLKIIGTPTDLTCFENATELETLWLEGGRMVSWDESVSIQDDRLRAFCGATKLEAVHIEGSAATSSGLRVMLQSKPQLEKLYLDGWFVTDDAMESLQGLPKLQSLTIFGKVGDDGLRLVGKLGSLQRLEIWRNHSPRKPPYITDAALRHLRGLTQLRELHLCLTKIKGPGLTFVSDMQSLKWLDLEFGELTDEGLQYLTHPGSLGLTLPGNESITRTGARELHERLPRLNFGPAGLAGYYPEPVAKVE